MDRGIERNQPLVPVPVYFQLVLLSLDSTRSSRVRLRVALSAHRGLKMEGFKIEAASGVDKFLHLNVALAKVSKGNVVLQKRRSGSVLTKPEATRQLI